MVMTSAMPQFGVRPARWPVAALIVVVLATAIAVTLLVVDQRGPSKVTAAALPAPARSADQPRADTANVVAVPGGVVTLGVYRGAHGRSCAVASLLSTGQSTPSASRPLCAAQASVSLTPTMGASVLHVADGSAARVELKLGDGTTVRRDLVDGFTLIPSAGLAGSITLLDANGVRTGTLTAPLSGGTAG